MVYFILFKLLYFRDQEVVPVNKKASDEACVSTDEDEEGEDEPLYFNILLIQDRAKNKMQTWYAKGSTQKLHESRALDRDTAVPKRKPVARDLPKWTKESILSSDSGWFCNDRCNMNRRWVAIEVNI